MYISGEVGGGGGIVGVLYTCHIWKWFVSKLLLIYC